jgi:two-component system sensor histidine kinase MtrB
VIDSGPGIDAALLPHIFDASVHPSPVARPVDLAHDRRRHGGQIRAENLPAGGAAFHITLPFVTAKNA